MNSFASKKWVADAVKTHIAKVLSKLIAPTWDNTTTYAKGDTITYKSKLWRCLIGNEGVEPVEGEYWTEGSVVNKNVYSTEETIIGTWIDGKPLYRRVLTGDFNESTTTKVVNGPRTQFKCDVDIDNIDIVKSYSCYLIRKTDGVLHSMLHLPVTSIIGASSATTAYVQYTFYLWIDGNRKVSLVQQGSHTTTIDGEYVLTLEYTKTTD